MNPSVDDRLQISTPVFSLSRAIPASARQVTKRDGSQVKFDLNKISRAIALAFYDVKTDGAENPYRNDMLALYGLDADAFHAVTKISDQVSKGLELYYRDGRHPTIEQIQNMVEMTIVMAGHWEVARAFMSYRLTHAARRLNRYGDSGLADYIAMAKYARYRPELGRRETFAEGVVRVREMHRVFFADKLECATPVELPPEVSTLADGNAGLLKGLLADTTLEDLIEEAFAKVADKTVLPSMRSMQFGGKAILKNEARLFNCSFSNLDRVDFFREYFWLLLCGCGVGFSVQKHHVALLPPLPKRGNEFDMEVVHHEVADTIEGWADSLDALIRSYYDGRKVEFNFAKIRPRGTPLKTSGGKAPGHMPLKLALAKVEEILTNASGRNLRSIELYDICMHVAGAVLSGGIRRSATICLFSPDDEEMMAAKTGNWFEKNPQRSASNNSAVLSRNENNREHFRKLFAAQKEFGEPGFYFCDNPDAGANPCVEIGLLPVIENVTPEIESKLYAYGYKGDLPATTRLSGFQMCNLTTINGAACANEEEFYKASIYAATIGTLQAAYTNMPYLGPVTRVINETDALLGVSICGFMDNPQLFFNPLTLTKGARLARATNLLVAKLIGINPAARVTCVKPEGTASLLLNAASGIHPHHSRHYFRRVQANRKEAIYLHFKAMNPQMTEPSIYRPHTDDCITFPVEAPKHALLRSELTAIQFLDLVKLVQQAWVLNGTSESNRSPDVLHNVSNTCTVNTDEWDKVREFIWANRRFFTGISLLAATGDKAYAQAPREAVVSEGDVARWNALQPREVDYTTLHEKTDETKLKEIIACAGGACELSI
ncbi:MAG: ATP cone domain-containing protein [Opitutaceae bacterium]|nr:ATP cone domain-containing protein [Opitutaceae bacterium]